jgi:rubrerythrin
MYNVLRLAEQFEIDTFKFFTSKKNEVKSKTVAELFDYLAQMEEEHIELIRRLIKSLEEGARIDSLPEQDKKHYKSRYEGQKTSETSPEDVVADLSILRMAYLIEKYFMEFYEKAANSEKDERVKKLFLVLRDWEKGHARIIENEIKSLLERNNLELGFYPF